MIPERIPECLLDKPTLEVWASALTTILDPIKDSLKYFMKYLVSQDNGIYCEAWEHLMNIVRDIWGPEIEEVFLSLTEDNDGFVIITDLVEWERAIEALL